MMLLLLEKTDNGDYVVRTEFGKPKVVPTSLIFFDENMPRIFVDETKMEVTRARLIRGAREVIENL